jgi:hypothetical protein
VEWFNKKLDSTYFPVAIIRKIVIAKCREMINVHFVAYVCIFVIFLLFAFLRFKDNTYKTKSHLLPLEIPIEIWEKKKDNSKWAYTKSIEAQLTLEFNCGIGESEFKFLSHYQKKNLNGRTIKYHLFH